MSLDLEVVIPGTGFQLKSVASASGSLKLALETHTVLEESQVHMLVVSVCHTV